MNITVKPNEDANKVTFDISCITSFVTIPNLILNINSDQDNNTFPPKNFSCDSKTRVNFGSLHKGTTYRYSIVWVSADNIDCELMTDTFPTSREYLCMND